MKTVEYDVLGFIVCPTNIPETLTEAVSLAGSEDAVRDNHTDYVVYHKFLGPVREKLCQWLEKTTKIEREFKMVKEKKIITEKAGPYVTRVRKTLEKDVCDAYAAEIKVMFPEVSWVPGTRGAGRVAAKWLDFADQVIESEAYAPFAARWNIDTTKDEEEVQLAIALKIKELMEKDEKDRFASMVGSAT